MIEVFVMVFVAALDILFPAAVGAIFAIGLEAVSGEVLKVGGLPIDVLGASVGALYGAYCFPGSFGKQVEQIKRSPWEVLLVTLVFFSVPALAFYLI